MLQHSFSQASGLLDGFTLGVTPQEERWAEFAFNGGRKPQKDRQRSSIKEGARKRSTFESQARQDPIRKDADIFARELLATLLSPDSTDEGENNKNLEAIKGLVIAFADDREAKAFHTLGHHRIRQARNRYQKKQLIKKLQSSRAAFLQKVKETLIQIGISADDKTAMYTYLAIRSYADRVDYRRFDHGDTDDTPCRATRESLIALKEIYEPDPPSTVLIIIDEDELNVDDVQTYCQNADSGLSLGDVFISLNPAFRYLLDLDEPDNEPIVELTVEACELQQCCSCGHMRITTVEALEQLELREKAACDIFEMPA